MKKAGEIYTGAHSFRGNYACERFNELEKTKGYDYAEQTLTRELGHSRVEMSHYYRN